MTSENNAGTMDSSFTLLFSDVFGLLLRGSDGASQPDTAEAGDKTGNLNVSVFAQGNSPLKEEATGDTEEQSESKRQNESKGDQTPEVTAGGPRETGSFLDMALVEADTLQQPRGQVERPEFKQSNIMDEAPSPKFETFEELPDVTEAPGPGPDFRDEDSVGFLSPYRPPIFIAAFIGIQPRVSLAEPRAEDASTLNLSSENSESASAIGRQEKNDTPMPANSNKEHIFLPPEESFPAKVETDAKRRLTASQISVWAPNPLIESSETKTGGEKGTRIDQKGHLANRTETRLGSGPFFAVDNGNPPEGGEQDEAEADRGSVPATSGLTTLQQSIDSHTGAGLGDEGPQGISASAYGLFLQSEGRERITPDISEEIFSSKGAGVGLPPSQPVSGLRSNRRVDSPADIQDQELESGETGSIMVEPGDRPTQGPDSLRAKGAQNGNGSAEAGGSQGSGAVTVSAGEVTVPWQEPGSRILWEQGHSGNLHSSFGDNVISYKTVGKMGSPAAQEIVLQKPEAPAPRQELRLPSDRESPQKVEGATPYLISNPSASGAEPAHAVVDLTPLIAKVAGEIHTSVEGRRQEAVLQLDPPELGKLRISIVVEGDKVEARVISETLQGGDLIQRHLPELRGALQAHSLNLGEVTVDAGHWSGGNGTLGHEARREPSPAEDDFFMNGQQGKPTRKRRSAVNGDQDSGVNVWV